MGFAPPAIIILEGLAHRGRIAYSRRPIRELDERVNDTPPFFGLTKCATPNFSTQHFPLWIEIDANDLRMPSTRD